MAQTSEAIAGCTVAIEVDNSGGTPVNVSGSSSKADLSFDKQIVEGHTFEGEYPVRVECKKNSSLNISVMWTRNGTEGRAILEEWYQSGGLRTVTVYPEGLINGGRSYSGEYFLKSLKFPLDAQSSSIVMMEAELMPSGAITFSNYTT